MNTSAIRLPQRHFLLYFLLHASIVVTFLGDLYSRETVFSAIALLLIVGGCLVLGRVEYDRFFMVVFLFVLAAYVASPGKLKIGVSVLPFIGLFLSMPRVHLARYVRRDRNAVRLTSLAIIILIHLVAYVGFTTRELNFVNNMSALYVYVLLVNSIFFGEPFAESVIAAVLLPVFLSPGGIGNRSAVFLILFLFNRRYLGIIGQKIGRYLSAKRVFVLWAILLVGVALFVFLVSHPKFFNPAYEEPRLKWLSQSLAMIGDEGFPAYFQKGTELLPANNPHNSFLWLMLNDEWVGVVKAVFFLGSSFVVPTSAWLAVFARASFDSFFFSGQLGIIYVAYVALSKRQKNAGINRTTGTNGWGQPEQPTIS